MRSIKLLLPLDNVYSYTPVYSPTKTILFRCLVFASWGGHVLLCLLPVFHVLLLSLVPLFHAPFITARGVSCFLI